MKNRHLFLCSLAVGVLLIVLLLIVAGAFSIEAANPQTEKGDRETYEAIANGATGLLCLGTFVILASSFGYFVTKPPEGRELPSDIESPKVRQAAEIFSRIPGAGRRNNNS